jgi:Ca2+/Na+ antiporter
MFWASWWGSRPVYATRRHLFLLLLFIAMIASATFYVLAFLDGDVPVIIISAIAFVAVAVMFFVLLFSRRRVEDE